MRFMMLMYPDEKAEAGALPEADLVSEMMKYNEELAKANALISLDGLHPSSKGARIKFSSGKPVVVDGPFAESKEVIGGYWIIDVKSKDEAIEWAKRVPARGSKMVEVRQIFEMTDFPEDVQKAADNPIVREQVEKQKR
jgi:hypothetical protein